MAVLAALVIAGTAHAQDAEAPRVQPDEPGEESATPGGVPWIQGQSMEARKRARGLFLEANVLLADTLFARAAAKYEQAIAIWAHPAFFYNLALARIHLDQPIEAYESMRQAVRHGAEPLGQDLYQNAQNFLALLDGQLAEIEVVCDEPEATVTLDGKPLFVGPGHHRVLVLPGGHMLMATKNGHLPDSKQIILAPGEQARFSLAPPYPEALVTERRWSAWVPWVVVGAGAVVMSGGGYLDWRSSTTFARYDRGVELLCPGNTGCNPGRIADDLHEQQERAEMQQRTARGIYLAGGAVAAAGAVLLYLNRERPVRRRGLVETSDVSLLPMLTPHVIGLGAGVTF